MTAPLLKTKLFVPPLRSEFVPRPRLIAQLDQGVQQGCRLILVSAPAGYGKTTLISAWIRHCDRRVRAAWVSLTEGDNDPASFWTYMTAAFDSIREDNGPALDATFDALHPVPPESAVISLLNHVAELTYPVVLVLDDYHVIRNPEVHKALSLVLESMPPQMHLVIATRADPPLPLPRLRGRGQLIEVYQADLRFTPQETAEFLAQVVARDLASDDVAALAKRTEGWITGLQMAAVSIRGRDDVSGFVRAFAGSNRYILDYLAEEVLRRQPEAVQAFLLETAVLEQLCGGLCQAVVGADAHGDSQSMLETLERSNLFLVALDDERRWYRYHQLFADLLRQRLQRKDPHLVPELHRRASAWYDQAGMMPQAVDHTLAAADFDRAVHIIEREAWPMLARGEMTTVLGWLERLPDEVVGGLQSLTILRAWALALTGQVDHARAQLDGAELAAVPGELAALRAYLADQAGDPEQARAFSQEALDLLPQDSLFLRGLITLVLGTVVYWTGGEPQPAIRALDRAAQFGQASGSVPLDVTVTCTLGHVQMMQGQLHLAAATFRRAFEIATVAGKPTTLFVGLGHAGIAEILYEWNELHEAMRHAREGIALGERAESVDILQGGYSYIVLARIYQAQGDAEQALQILNKAEQFAERRQQTHVATLAAAFRAWVWLAEGDLGAASRWLAARQSAARAEPDYAREFEYLTWARILLAQERRDEALVLTTRLKRLAEAKGRIGRLIVILALEALVHSAQGAAGQALGALERALSLAEPKGGVRTFIDLGEPMAALLRRALSQDIVPGYAARLLAAFGQEAAPPTEAFKPLTEREQEVLRLIVAGLSNQEIAEQLVIAMSTVKSHVNHIFGKLGVRNRVQASVQARELGLV